MSIGLTLILGVMGIINFAHGELVMLAMYIGYWLFTLLGIDPLVSFSFCMILLFVIGVGIEKSLIMPIKYSPETSSLLVTLGLSMFLQNMALFLWKPDFRSVVTGYSTKVVTVGSLYIRFSQVVAFIIALSLTGVLYIFLRKTYTGKAIRATVQDRETAMLMGINTKHIDLLAFGIGAACVGGAGAIITPIYFVFPTIGAIFVLTCFVVVVVGGMGSVVGAFFGGLIIGIAESAGVMLLGTQCKSIIPFIIFIIILLFKPLGLFGTGKY